VLSRARRLQEARRAPEARAVLEDFLGEVPFSIPALAMLAEVGRVLGDSGLALPYAERAVANSGFDSPGLVRVWIRSLAGSGARDSAVAAARRWVSEDPGQPSAHAELATLLMATGENSEAIRVLRQGRARAGGGSLYTQEISALLVRTGDYDAAAVEWVAMLEWGQAGVRAVEFRLRDPPSAYGQGVNALRARLLAPDVSFRARRSGLDLALHLSEEALSQELAEALVATTPPATRVAVLREYSLETRNRSFGEGAAWAAVRLAREAPSEDERAYWRAVAADLALEAGDGDEARAALEEILADSEPGSEAHRLAARRLFSLRVEEQPTGAATMLAEYAEAYPDDQLDAAGMAVALSHRLAADGDLRGARQILDSGAVSDASAAARLALQKGRVALYKGDPVGAMSHLETAALIPADDPEGRREAITILSALERADSASAVELGSAAFALVRGHEPAEMVERARGWSRRGDPAAPALMTVAAAALDRAGYARAAAEVLRELVESWPEAPERPAALLALARRAATEDVPSAAALLERLIVDHPGSALAPVARRLLAELYSQMPGA
jgi:hypothetical protein